MPSRSETTVADRADGGSAAPVNPATPRAGWVLSRRADFLVFTGPLLLGLAWIAIAAAGGFLHDPLPLWAFAVLIVGCDVAHVYATAYRVYLDPEERRRRPALYYGAPLLCLIVGILLHSASAVAFWRVLAYLAAFHFVRQQWGWMAFSARRAGESDRRGRLFDQVAIYNATLFPLLWWHLHLPRSFTWFLEGDFWPGLRAAPAAALVAAQAVHWALHLAWLVVWWRRGAGRNWAKLQIYLTTWVAWYGGIVLLDSDLAFTTLNVLSHGVPYLAFVIRYESARWIGRDGFVARLFQRRRLGWILGALVVVAFVEEWLWDRLVWHEFGGLFPGPGVDPGVVMLHLLVPLLAVPQATHYVLDGWLWRTADNPRLRAWLDEGAQS